MPEYLKAFLEDLTELCKKHDNYIGGCGCCGSPYIINDLDDCINIEDLYYDKEKGKYTVTITKVRKGWKKGYYNSPVEDEE